MSKRKMTPEQREAAVERLRIAREKRLKENPPEYKNIHSKVKNLPDDDIFSLKNVRKWIKTQRELLLSAKSDARNNIKGAESKIMDIQGYIRHCEDYIKYGDWIDMRCGEYQEKKVTFKCTSMAYDAAGNPKRVVGIWYPDIACEWTREMDDEERNRK